jgi:CBS domain-containing protein
MKRGAVTCQENTSIKDVAQIMVYNRIRYCVVLDKNHDVAGIISARSILKACGRDLDTTLASDILMPYTITIYPHHSLADAIELMITRRIEHVVVISNRPGKKSVYGILSAADLVRKMARR